MKISNIRLNPILQFKILGVTGNELPETVFPDKMPSKTLMRFNQVTKAMNLAIILTRTKALIKKGTNAQDRIIDQCIVNSISYDIGFGYVNLEISNDELKKNFNIKASNKGVIITKATDADWMIDA